LVEFTGERVIPGQVTDDLWSEHVARYAYARRFADHKRVLDAGCGTGYGSAELALAAASVTGIDISQEAIALARSNYLLPGLRFALSSCTAMPFPANRFDLIVAFEVIEHLTDYRAFLQECARVLTHQGLFIVSSPNKRYYAESRAATGPNPYHHHEFEADEFVDELARVFSNVRVLLQNRVESFAFHPTAPFWPADARIDSGGGMAEDAHFFIGLCSSGPLPDPRSFVYVPKAANLLRERELHVKLLQQQLAQGLSERDSVLDLFRRQNQELEERNRWAELLNVDLKAAGERIVELQNEAADLAAGYQAQVASLEEADRVKTEWARKTAAELAECARLLDAAEATVRERTLWGQTAEAQRQELAAQLETIRSSRWLKLSRKVGLGPVVNEP
jgi:ubiquinone/menaquinone biosynthesis C-methylase UbiE